MLKFPQGMGTSNINLTMDYIQEDEEYPTQVLDEEERKQFSQLVSGFILFKPLIMNIWTV